MPLPTPQKGEPKNKFISRCVTDSVMKGEFPKRRQRLAVCHSQWRQAKEHHEAHEAKDLRQTDEETQRRLDAAARSMPDSRKKRRVQRVIEVLGSGLASDLNSIANAVVAKRLNPREASDRAREAMAPRVMRAVRRGFSIAGLPNWQMTAAQEGTVNAFLEDEIEFFRRFMEEIHGSEAMGRRQRTSLYGGSMLAAFGHGWLMVLPSDAMIEWRLGIAEHCVDCLKLAAESPYSPPGRGTNPLPTVPRNGDTRCLTNCRCYLITVAGQIRSSLINQVEVEVTAIGGTAIDPTSPGARAAALLYQELAERYAYHRRLELLEPDAGHGAAAEELLAGIERLARLNGHTVRMATTLAEIIAPVQLAQAFGLRYVSGTDIDEDLVLAVATVLALNSADRGVVSSVTENPPTVTLDGERTYRVDDIGRNILFVED